MSDSEKLRRAKEDLSQRLELAKALFPELKELSDNGGKNAVIRFFVDKYGEEPIEQGNLLYFRK